MKHKCTYLKKMIFTNPVLIAIFIAISIISTSCSSGVSTYPKNQSNIDYPRLYMEQTRKLIELKMNKLENWCTEISYSQTMNDSLRDYEAGSNAKKAEMLVGLNRYLSAKAAGAAEVKNIILTLPNGKVIAPILVSDAQKEKTLKELVTDAVNSNERLKWTLADIGGSSRNIILYGKVVDVLAGKVLGCILMEIDSQTFFETVIPDSHASGPAEIFMIDESNTVVAKGNSNLAVGMKYNDTTLLEKIKKYDNESKQKTTESDVYIFTLEIQGKKYSALCTPLRNSGWYVVNMVPSST